LDKFNLLKGIKGVIVATGQESFVESDSVKVLYQTLKISWKILCDNFSIDRMKT